MSVVGVAGDVKLDRSRVRASRFVYMPYSQVPAPWAFPYEIAVRTSVPPETLTSAVRKEVAAVDGELAIAKVRTMDEILSTSIAKQRFNFLLMGLFAALALALVTAGIYGVVSYGVLQRTHEIGVRMALGAKPADVLQLVLKGGMKLIAVGLALGIAGAIFLTRAMTTLLVGVKPTDAITFASVSVLLAGIALLACYLPARRASRVDPIVALHYE
jgi:putative ABC transport system permease protein